MNKFAAVFCHHGHKHLISIIILLILFISPVFSAKIVPLEEPLKPNIIAVGEDRVYVIEDITIYIYSLQDFGLIKKFGKKGEGPGEFKGRIYSIDILPEQIIVNSEARVSHFTRDGDFIRQANTKSVSINFLPVADNLVGFRLLAVDRTLYFAIDIYDKKLNKIKEIHRFKHPFQPRKPVNLTDIRVCSYHVAGNKIFIDKENGIIDVYDKDGEKLFSIDPKIEKIKITEEHKKKYLDLWKSNHVLRAEYNSLKERFKFPSHFSAIRDFQIIDGNIYIQTYKEKDGKSEMLIYSTKGKLLKKALVPLADVAILLPQIYNFYTIKNGKIYTLVENPETEIWELHITSF